MYRVATGRDTFEVESAKPSVPEGLLAELTDAIRTLLHRYTVDDRFGNALVHIFGGSPVLGVAEFVLNVVRAAATLGPERAAQWLSEWASGASVPYQLSAVFSGLTVDQPLEMGRGVRFMTLPYSFSDDGVHLPFGSTFHFGQSSIMGALKVTIDCMAGPALCKPEEIELSPPERTWDYGPVSGDPLATLCEVLSLVCNCHVSSRMQWPDWSEEVKAFRLVLGSGFSFSAENAFFPPSSTTMKEEHLKDVRGLLVKRLEDVAPRKGLNLAISRWMRSKSRTSYADQFIELRIALEALYLTDTNVELGFRLATRGAWHLGTDFGERSEYRELLHQVYRKASNAVHAHEVQHNEESRKLLADAQDLCRMGILKRLDETEEPNWNEVILGKDYDV